MKDKFEELYKIKMLRQLLLMEEEDRGEWKVERTVISDIYQKIRWAKYGYEMAMQDIEKGRNSTQ